MGAVCVRGPPLCHSATHHSQGQGLVLQTWLPGPIPKGAGGLDGSQRL